MSTTDVDPHVCALCGGSDYRLVCEKAGARYVQCAGCSVVRQHPYPSADDIAAYYEHYQSHKTAQSDYLSEAGYGAFRRDKLLTFADLGLPADGFAGKAVLDVGCATGQFLHMLADSGAARVHGVDASAECIATARANGLDCERADFLALQGSYDVVTMWHLIEHLPRPQDFLRHAHELLAPGGWLLIETPVIGLISEAFGADWRYFMPTEHINLFTPDALIRFASQAGFSMRGQVRFGSGNDSGVMPAINKRAMDRIAKQSGFGDTLVLWLVKNP